MKRTGIFLILVLISVSFSSVCLADDNREYDYRGVIGDNRIGLSIVLAGKDVLGEYFYIRWLKDIPLKGKIDGRKIILNELDEHGKITAIFKGQFFDHAPDYLEAPIQYEVMEGEWSRPDGNEQKRFRLVADTGGIWGKSLYSVAGFDNDQMVESFARKVKRAFLVDDKTKIASMIEYPISVKIKGKAVLLKNKLDFIRLYKKIFNQDFFEEMKDSVPHKMFSNSEGVMLGMRGEIWIAERNARIRITQINNDAPEVSKFKVLWRIHNGADIALDEDYLKKAPDQIKAILGYLSASTGSECQWENDHANADMSNLKCRLTSALGLGYQASKKHRDFLHYWFRNDRKLSKFDAFSDVPFTATIQDSFDYINMQWLDGGEIKVDYKIIETNDREDSYNYEIYSDRFRVFSDQVIMVSDKLIAKGKE